MPNHFGTEEIVQFRQVFGLHRFKLHRHLVDGTVNSVLFRQVFSLLGVPIHALDVSFNKKVLKLFDITKPKMTNTC